ncbi:MAG TPA: YihY/virulence factor BrkB family protein [Blastocatellia bacterium]|jgi:membrane protein|nr:YihY/virulence factor BrkB family protein [Blastocatellia bacterium]
MKNHWLGGLSLGELAYKIWLEIYDGTVFSRAAELAYYFSLALFPMLIFLTSLIGFLPDAQENIFRALSSVMPGEAMKLVRETIHDVVRNRSGGLIPFGVLGAFWAASGGVSAVMNALSDAYGVKEGRPFWKVRLTAIGLTAILAMLIIVGVILIMFGDHFSVWLAARLGLGAAFAVFWGVVDYLLGLAFVLLGLQLIYYFGPNIKQAWRWITHGAVFAVVGLVIASLLLSLYLRYGPSYSAIYGSLGAVIVLMLWLYLMGAAVIIGGEINANISQAADRAIDQNRSLNG